MSITSSLTIPPSSSEDYGDVKAKASEITENGITNFQTDAVEVGSPDNSEMTAEQQSLMTSSVSDSQHPEAHLEALDTIITCTKLLQTTSGDGQASIAALVRQAKALLLDNTVTVILATLREFHRQEEEESSSSPRLPAFWSQVYSPQELKSWLQLLDMILYCWGNKSETAPAFVEKYVQSYTEEIRQLRQRHNFDMCDLVDGGDNCLKRVQDQLLVVKSSLRPGHWTLINGMKKFNRGKMEDLWHVLTATLQICGILDPEATKTNENSRSSTNLLPLNEMKTALSKVTFANLDRLGDFEAIMKDDKYLRLLRQDWLPSPHFDENKLRSVNMTNMANPAWHAIPSLAANFVTYLRSVEELTRLRDRLSMRKETTIRETIYLRLLTMAAGQLNTIQKHQQWQKVPQVLKETIIARRKEMAERCSVSAINENLESPTNSVVSSTPSMSTSMSFSVNLETSEHITWNLSFVKNPMANIL